MINILNNVELVIMGIFVTSPIWIPIILSIVIFISNLIKRRNNKW